MSLKRTLIKGTFLLTAAGMISRLIGFYYRIFLTHTIGAEGIGIYQLIFPVYALCFSLTSAGIQTTISRLVAANDTPAKQCNQITIYRIGLILMTGLSIAASAVLYGKADWIALHIIQEPRCAQLLTVLAYTIPISSLHSAVCGYYYGIKKASIPSLTQLAEQLARVGGVYLLTDICQSRHQAVSIQLAVWGLVIGEAVSALISFTAVRIHFGQMQKLPPDTHRKTPRLILFSQIIKQSVPLTMNRLCINILQSAEAILIPSMLKRHGLSTETALSTYGTLTGMALPLILFPSALTNSVSVMLLPTIAQAQAANQRSAIENAVGKALKYCLLLGIYCTGIFLYLGMDMGLVLYHSEEAGRFIITLAWLCPFLYLTTTLGSVVHGLGKTFLYFIYNSVCLLIQIGFVVCAIPTIGILGYLWGVLASHLVLTLLLLYCLNKEYHIQFQPAGHIVLPVFYIAVSISLCRLLHPLFNASLPALAVLGIKGLVVTAVYIGMACYYGSIPIFKRSRALLSRGQQEK